jgi:hypothetical protein
MAMAAVVILLLGAMGVFTYVLLTRQPEPMERVVIKEAPSVRDVAGAKDKNDEDEDEDDKDAKDAKDAKDKEEDEDAKEGEEKAAKANPGGGGASSAKRRRPRSSSGSRSSSSSSKPDPKPAESTPNDPKPAAAAGGGGGGGGSDALDVDCILNPDLPKCKGGTTSTKKAKPAGSSDPNLPEKLTVSDIREGVASVKATAKSCGGKHSAAAGTSVKVRMSISGSTGRVVSAKAEPPHTGTALGNCVAGAVKKATFKKFRDAQMGVVYPFRM